jgi:hypothetical protein
VLLKLQEERSIGTRAVFRELSKLGGSTFAFKRYPFHFHSLRPSQSQITRAENVPSEPIHQQNSSVKALIPALVSLKLPDTLETLIAAPRNISSPLRGTGKLKACLRS